MGISLSLANLLLNATKTVMENSTRTTLLKTMEMSPMNSSMPPSIRSIKTMMELLVQKNSSVPSRTSLVSLDTKLPKVTGNMSEDSGKMPLQLMDQNLMRINSINSLKNSSVTTRSLNKLSSLPTKVRTQVMRKNPETIDISKQLTQTFI